MSGFEIFEDILNFKNRNNLKCCISGKSCPEILQRNLTPER